MSDRKELKTGWSIATTQSAGRSGKASRPELRMTWSFVSDAAPQEEPATEAPRTQSR
jgi:hypothetical protein